MTNLFKKRAVLALLITLSGAQNTQASSERHGLIGNTFGFAGDTVKGAGRVAGGAVEGTGKVAGGAVEGTGDVLTGNRRQRRRQSRNQSSSKAKSMKQRNQELEMENQRLRDQLGE